MNSLKKKVAVLGASRGLGLAISNTFTAECSDSQLLLVSRKIKSTLEQLHQQTQTDYQKNRLLQMSSFTCDFSSTENLSPLMNQLVSFNPNQIIYVSGGGPFGDFQTKNWKDHHWALNVNLLFPAELLHRVLNSIKDKNEFPQLTQFVFTGSAIAESFPDPKSASYAMAKHGLKGLITSIQKENPPIDVRLFSPGYIDTLLLPPNAWPRQEQKKIHNPEDLAQILYKWCNNSQFKNQHLELEHFSK
jgi:short-subunit dehydrogenase